MYPFPKEVQLAYKLTDKQIRNMDLFEWIDNGGKVSVSTKARGKLGGIASTRTDPGYENGIHVMKRGLLSMSMRERGLASCKTDDVDALIQKCLTDEVLDLPFCEDVERLLMALLDLGQADCEIGQHWSVALQRLTVPMHDRNNEWHKVQGHTVNGDFEYTSPSEEAEAKKQLRLIRERKQTGFECLPCNVHIKKWTQSHYHEHTLTESHKRQMIRGTIAEPLYLPTSPGVENPEAGSKVQTSAKGSSVRCVCGGSFAVSLVQMRQQHLNTTRHRNWANGCSERLLQTEPSVNADELRSAIKRKSDGGESSSTQPSKKRAVR